MTTDCAEVCATEGRDLSYSELLVALLQVTLERDEWRDAYMELAKRLNVLEC